MQQDAAWGIFCLSKAEIVEKAGAGAPRVVPFHSPKSLELGIIGIIPERPYGVVVADKAAFLICSVNYALYKFLCVPALAHPRFLHFLCDVRSCVAPYGTFAEGRGSAASEVWRVNIKVIAFAVAPPSSVGHGNFNACDR